ncbi:MAG: type II toxin-antitoxin system mRNA interferase toxin, RelE/StbE family [Campylobacteraceae bacterium]|nr:type II toxin-antitoxin system mRNA interferase toxin, RelE/StbE family [Campylobacteraceae bacterium]
MYIIDQTELFERTAQKFFKKHRNLLPKFVEVIQMLQSDPFSPSLKTHKLKGELSKYHACRLTYEYRIIVTIVITEEQIILMDIGSHDEVY